MICLCSTLFAGAQSGPEARILLDDYSYTAKDNLVGEISVHGLESAAAGSASAGGFVLKGENTGKFKVKGNKLFIRKKYARSSEKWFDVTLETENGAFSADFRILKDEFHDNGVVAHRGAWKNTKAPQNSIASFNEAVKLGCEGSEFDVHLTADSVTILFHDRDIEGLPIEETGYDELAARTLGNGEAAPRLVDFLKEAMDQNTTRMVLEIKPSAVSKERGIALTEKIVRQVREAKAQAWVDYISFGYDICQRILELNPYANVAYLNGDKAPAAAASDKLFGLDYNQKVFREKPDWIAEAKDNGLTLNVWTVNDAEGMDWFLEKEFDFITTDEPEMLLEKVKGE